MADTPTPAANSAAPASTTSEVTNETQENIDSSTDESNSTPSSEATSSDAKLAEKIAEQNPELTKKEVKKMIKELKYKFNGQEMSEELPFEIPDDPKAIEYMKKQIQMSKLSSTKSQENAQLKKEIETFFKTFQGDPEVAMKQLGLDVDKFAEEVINKRIEDMKKSPEQREKEKLEKELNDLRKKLEAEEADKQTRQMEAMQEKFAIELDRDITDALSSNSKLPKSPYVVKRIADVMALALENGYKDVSAKDVLPIVEKQINEEIQNMFGAMPEEVMEQLIGKPNLERMRSTRLKKAKKPVETASQVKATGTAPTKADAAKAAEKVPMKDFFKKLGRF